MRCEWPEVYAVQHLDEQVRASSRSGGIFTAVSDYILENHGVIYGCILNEEFRAVHVRATDKRERDKMRGSKYIQSRLGDTYQSVKSDLEAQKLVLFSGTSCQIAGLRKYLGKEYNNLFCVDIVCHGVPSPNVWFAYLDWQKKRAGSEIETVDFRNKKDFGWRRHVETVFFKNGKKVNSTVFVMLFCGHAVLRPSCYVCPFKSVMHPGDMTIADYWGIEKAAPEFDDNKGVSLVLINNETGKRLFETVKPRVRWKATKLEDSMQEPLRAPFPEPANRRTFWNDFALKDFSYIAKKYGGEGMVNQIKRNIKKIKRKLLK